MSETSQGFTRQDDNTLDKYCITFIGGYMIRILFRDIFANSYLFPTLHSKRRKRVFSEDTYLKAPMNYCRSTFFSPCSLKKSVICTITEEPNWGIRAENSRKHQLMGSNQCWLVMVLLFLRIQENYKFTVSKMDFINTGFCSEHKWTCKKKKSIF